MDDLRPTNDQLLLMITEMRDKIEQGWRQGEYARDAKGRGVCVEDKSACEWCLHGAIILVASKHNFSTFLKRKNALADTMVTVFPTKYIGTISFNDDHCSSQNQMLATIDMAIARTEHLGKIETTK